MAEEIYGAEVSKKKTITENIVDYIPDWIPGITELRDMKKRIEGKSEKKIKKEIPFGEYE